MMHGWRSHRVMGLVTTLLLGSACHGEDRAARDALLARSDAARLVGGWNVTLVLERPLGQLYDVGGAAPSISGTMAFTENRASEEAFADFGSVTHKAVYDLDLSAFRLPATGDARMQVGVARTTPVRGAAPARGADSVSIDLSPADTRLRLRLAGLLAGDSIAGGWTAEFLRREASGRFVMTRRGQAP